MEYSVAIKKNGVEICKIRKHKTSVQTEKNAVDTPTYYGENDSWFLCKIISVYKQHA